MSNHNGNANKMVDTPRTDAEMVEMTTGDGPVKTRTKWVHSSVCIQLERELNAANSRIELLMSANADVARIAGERDAAEKRIRLLIAERDTARLQADKKHSLRGEFESLLGTDKIEEGIKAVKALMDHIKRLEEAGDALKAAGYFGGFNGAVNKWIKAKEDKL